MHSLFWLLSGMFVWKHTRGLLLSEKTIRNWRASQLGQISSKAPWKYTDHVNVVFDVAQYGSSPDQIVHNVCGFCYIWLRFNWTKKSSKTLQTDDPSAQQVWCDYCYSIHNFIAKEVYQMILWCKVLLYGKKRNSASELGCWADIQPKVCDFNDFCKQFELNLFNGTLWVYKLKLHRCNMNERSTLSTWNS